MNSSLRKSYLEAMGIQPWVRRGLQQADAQPVEAPAASTQPVQAPPAVGASPAPSCATLDWPQLESAVASCTACELHRTRTHTVFGTGSRQADWMIIGEAPGADEDRQGEPFVGRAGQLLTEMLRAAGLQRQEVFITNILKCRPPQNRDPRPEEVASCHAFLQRQVALVRPSLILAVGRIAAHNLLETDTPVGRLRGRIHHYGEGRIPLIVTYHPAYLLRSPLEKRKAWEDLRLALQVAAAGHQALDS
jgi:uracil-DNA glycosylase family 4